jgi:hypothetical protein
MMPLRLSCRGALPACILLIGSVFTTGPAFATAPDEGAPKV